MTGLNTTSFVVEKIFCPLCGCATIRPVKGRFRCLNCKALFFKPKGAKTELRKRPRYIK